MSRGGHRLGAANGRPLGSGSVRNQNTPQNQRPKIKLRGKSVYVPSFSMRDKLISRRKRRMQDRSLLEFFPSHTTDEPVAREAEPSVLLSSDTESERLQADPQERESEDPVNEITDPIPEILPPILETAKPQSGSTQVSETPTTTTATTKPRRKPPRYDL